MLTVLEAIKLSTDYLQGRGIESPRINAELLLSEILNCKRLDLYLSFDKPLQQYEIDKYRDWLARRGKFEPLQYIIGKTEFYGLVFNINSTVLIPRQETEILVETILKECKANEKYRVLDIGTGSGNIAVTLAKFLPNSEIVAVDNSEDTLKIAFQNAQMHNVNDRIQFKKLDITDMNCLNELDSTFDIVVSNPPYVSLDEFEKLQKEITDYEPVTAVSDQDDGFKFYRIISVFSLKLLIKYGKLFFELGKDQSEQVEKILGENNFHNIKIIKDYLNIDRVIVGQKL